jgi:hypothetical protein
MHYYYSKNFAVHFVGYLYIMYLINARKMEHIKMNSFVSIQLQILYVSCYMRQWHEKLENSWWCKLNLYPTGEDIQILVHC